MRTTRPYILDTLRLAAPVAVARLGVIGLSLADVIVVGQFAPDELAHQALALAPVGVVVVTAIGLLTGVQVCAARVIGAGHEAAAGAVLRRGLVLALIAGGGASIALWLLGARVFTTFGVDTGLAASAAKVMAVLALSAPLHLVYVAGAYFLEALKRPLASSFIMWGGNGVNLALNFLWVPEHGAIGSAWATVCARLMLATAILAWIWYLRDGARYGVRARGAGPSYRELLGVGGAAAVSQAVEAGAFSAMTVVAARVSDAAVSGYQIILNVCAVVFMLAMGVAAACTVLVAEAVGRGARHEATRAGWTGLGVVLALMLGAACALLVAPQAIARIYTADAALGALVASVMWIAAIAVVPDGAQVVASAGLRARGDNWFPTASHVFAYALIMPALGYWLGERLGMGVAGLIWAIMIASFASIGVLLARWMWLTRRT